MEHSLIVDRESNDVDGRVIVILSFDNLRASNFKQAIDNFYKKSSNKKLVVRIVDSHTGETVKGPKYDTTVEKLNYDINKFLETGVKQKPPVETMRYEPRDRFQEIKNMKKEKFQNLIKECLSEVKRESDPRIKLKESLRNVVKQVLKEISSGTKPEPDKEEKEKISKGFAKDGNERISKTNVKLQKELESLVHGINADWSVYWDDHMQLNVDAKNLLRVRIAPKYENNFDIDAMVKLVDRIRVISVTWEQVKEFVKANFSDLKDETHTDIAKKKSMDNYEDREVIKKDAGPRSDIVKNRGEKKNGEDSKIKDTKRDDKNYNEPQTKKEEDMPDQPMKQVTEPGKDPESKNKNIEKTPQVKPPKHKSDDESNKLKTNLPATKKFRARK